ncbi:MAG TPA: 16S rRNA (guanine(527)-N(7))-methyltransferase RsmG [Mollicutes bacterium]|jgi:16S rRNA (guanine527-N7)-methyltransferase|nr:16S rRNA (guanine(527)-N(7))-methyltransferase RsmG [Mollicutes bacterium]
MTEDNFIKEMSKLGIELTITQLEQFQKYYKLLIEWNKKINLTSITQKEDVYLKHFYDSATIVKIINLDQESTLCDVGSGAGFPGIVIKILYPELKVTLIDSLMKRINFLNEVINKLNLKEVVAIHSRIEDFGQKNKEKFDVVTARAVAPLNILLEYCIPITKIDKYFISMKGNISREINSSENALNKLKSELIEIKEFHLPFENSVRSLVLIRKSQKTDKMYPRRVEKIKKKPL